ncbi:hypothetical protein HDV04_004198 [Boothiomyces sp. JEL0838]|nr:hypothetical protein HDV04_004198 [Boothiomyces sp. JEL0838]
MAYVPPDNIMLIFCFHFGCAFALSCVNLFPLLYMGKKLFANYSNILALGNAIFGILVQGLAIFPVLSPIASCVPDQLLLASYVATDVTVDIVLCMRCLMVIPTSNYSDWYKRGLVLAVVVVDFIVRLWHVGLTTFTLLPNIGCVLQTEEKSGLVATGLIIVLVLVYGLVFTFHLSKTSTLTSIGTKAAVFTVLLVIAKVGLLIPYVMQVMGPFSLILVGYQVAMQSICLTLTSMWIKQKPTTAKNNAVLRSKVDSGSANTGASSISRSVNP